MSQQRLTSLNPRRLEDVAAMALVTQANMLQLQTAAHRRLGMERPSVPSPGGVVRHREALIDWQDIKQYEEGALLVRLHEIWGQYCLFCWLFECNEPVRPPDFLKAATDGAVRCGGEVGTKLIEITRCLWRLRHEDRLRHDPDFKAAPDFQQQIRAADDIPMLVFGQNIRVCSNDDLFACTCQYAGMLAAIRWVADDRWKWGQAGIMEVDAEPAG